MTFDPNSATIIIALVSLLGVLAAALIWMLKWAIGHYGDDIQAHTKAANNLAKASENLAKSNKQMAEAVKKNTESNDQVLIFMKNLNGKLAKATIQTVKEQNVEHQHIERVE